MQTLPNTGSELVLDMLERFPEVLATPAMSMNEIQFRAGQRSVALHYASLMGRPVGELMAAVKARRGAGRQTRG